jgi:hypothetical protein
VKWHRFPAAYDPYSNGGAEWTHFAVMGLEQKVKFLAQPALLAIPGKLEIQPRGGAVQLKFGLQS